MGNTSVIEMLKIQYNDGYNMLSEFVKTCPDELWESDNHGLPVWNHVIHSLCGTYFWLRPDYTAELVWEFPIPENLREKIEKDDWCSSGDGFMTKEEINACFEILDKRLEKFWNSVTDDMLCNKVWEKHGFTYLSVISAQIRHIMCHVGMCNAALIENGSDEVQWIAYGEN